MNDADAEFDPAEPRPDPADARRAMFDAWAPSYDDRVRSIAADADYPFAGYDDVIARVVTLAVAERSAPRVLDLGTGTGEVAGRLLDHGAAVVASDYAPAMLETVRERLPAAVLALCDLAAEAWPDALDGPFDAITAAYVLHEFEPGVRAAILERAAARLAPEGCLVIGDIAFDDADARDAARARWAGRWDPDEHPLVADETLARAADLGLAGSWARCSPCAGVLVFNRSK